MDVAPTKKFPDPDRDTETPLQTHLAKALSLTNGSLKPHHHQYIQPSPLPPQEVVVSYKECLKNHAATLGGLALDGCGEFMPRPSATHLDPTSLKCAACGCHRNFHRRDPNGSPITHHSPPPAHHWTSSPSPGSTSSGPSQSPTSPASPTPQSYYSSAPHMLLALSTGHSWPLVDHQNQPARPSLDPTVMMNPHGRKRARTKFTEEQKEKMHVFAEKLGWKMARGNDERLLEQFCSEVGVKRNVFKVWMHNNKHRREKGNAHKCYDVNSTIDVNGNEGRVCSDTNVYSNSNNIDISNSDRYPIESKVHVHGSTDGSSPSC